MSDKPTVEWFTPYTLTREWGEEVIIAETPTHHGKILKMEAGAKGGLQYHVKEESHYLVSGTLKLRWDDGSGVLQEKVVTDGTAWRVPPGAVHQEEAVTDVVTFEVGDPTAHDRVRVESAYGLTVEGGLPSQPPPEAATMLRALAKALMDRAAQCVACAETIAQQ